MVKRSRDSEDEANQDLSQPKKIKTDDNSITTKSNNIPNDQSQLINTNKNLYLIYLSRLSKD